MAEIKTDLEQQEFLTESQPQEPPTLHPQFAAFNSLIELPPNIFVMLYSMYVCLSVFPDSIKIISQENHTRCR